MEALFLKVLNMSITASYVILAILAVRLLFKKAPKKYSYLLWSVVGFRLFCPVSFSSVISIFNTGVFNMTVAQSGGNAALSYIPEDIGHMAVPKVTVGIPSMNTLISSSLPSSSPAASVNPLQIWVLSGTVLWCAGIAVLSIYSLFTFARLKRRMATAVLLENNVFESDKICSPFVFGFIKPKIYIPFGLDEQKKAYILQHEVCHLQRRDHLVKPLAFLMLAFHWFNPLVWLAFVLMSRDMEMSCDERVLSVSGSGIIKDYCMSILSLAAKRRFPGASPLAFGEAGVSGRVKNALRFKKPKKQIAVIASMLCIIAVATCAANPRESAGASGTAELYGNYLFEATVYMNPLSSFYPFDDYVEYYTFTKDTLVITDKNGSQKSIPVQYNMAAVDTEKFKAAFDMDVGVPDITKYSERYQYTLNKTSSTTYCIYLMDSEIWLARINNGSMWSIYKLARLAGEIPSPTFGDVISSLTGDSYPYDADRHKNYLSGTDAIGRFAPYLNASPQIWDYGNDDKTDDESINRDAVTVVSEDNAILALVYDSPSDVLLQDVKDKIEYIKIDSESNNNKIKPFSVYAYGIEQFGSYNIYDAETFEPLDFFEPSGLAPQCCILQNTKAGHSYIIVLSVGEWDANGKNIVGSKFIFGVTIPG